MPRTTTSYAVLGLLSVRSWTTYELAKQVRRSLNWFWPRAERKLYDEPKTLVVDGLATAVREYTGQRPRTVYAITPAGRAALGEWLDQPSTPPTTEFEAMLKVFFADGGSLDQLTATLDDIETEAATRLADLVVLTEQGLTGDSGFPQRLHLGALTLRLQYQQERAVITWARWARDQVEQWLSTTDPGQWSHREVRADLLAETRQLLARRAR